MTPIRDDAESSAPEMARRRTVRLLDLGILLSAAAVVALSVAAIRAPHLAAAVPADAMRPQGGRAFAFTPGVTAHWPFVVPSRPAFPLRADDVRLSEDGRSIGALTASHDEIRSLGTGRHDLWNGDLWFSSGDGDDPQTNGRSYGVRIKARFAGSAVVALAASLALLAALLFRRVAIVLDSRRTRAQGAPSSRLSAAAARLTGFPPLILGRSFGLFCAAMLGAFGWNTVVRPMPLLFGDDSFTFVFPGVLWHAGESVAGQSTRDVGYAALTALALRLGSLRAIPQLQLLGVLVGIAGLLGVLFLMLGPLAARLACIPAGTLSASACALVAVYGVMLAGNDAFVLDIYRALAEALHFLPTALALLFFVLGWVASPPVRRLVSMVLAVFAADLSVAVKPHSSLVLALCVLGFLTTAVSARRGFRSPAILALFALSAALVVSVHRFDAWVTPAGFDFGPKLLFCNHLDVAEPVFEASTPERARVKEQIESTLRHAHPDWPLLGYHGDTCTFGDPFNRAMAAAARAEGLEPPAWEGREFAKAVVHNPIGYARAVWKQLAFALANPVVGTDGSGQGVITEREWRTFEPYAASIGTPRGAFDVAISSWVPAAFPEVAALGKALLGVVTATFAPVVLGATLAAAAVLFRLRTRGGVQAEVVLLAVAAFTAAFVLTPALAHTFDVHRYLTDVLPFSLLWWTMGVAYAAHGIVLACTRMAGARRRRASGPVAGPSSAAEPVAQSPKS